MRESSILKSSSRNLISLFYNPALVISKRQRGLQLDQEWSPSAISLWFRALLPLRREKCAKNHGRVIARVSARSMHRDLRHVAEAAACIISFPARGGSINATANSTGKKLREAVLNGSKCTPAMDEAVPFSNSPRGESCIRCSECMDQLPVFELVSRGPFAANRVWEYTISRILFSSLCAAAVLLSSTKFKVTREEKERWSIDLSIDWFNIH